MFTQTKEMKMGQLVDLDKGPVVKLLQQTGDHKVIYENAAGKEFTIPSSEFFQTHREATPKEVEASEAKAKRSAADA